MVPSIFFFPTYVDLLENVYNWYHAWLASTLTQLLQMQSYMLEFKFSDIFRFLGHEGIWVGAVRPLAGWGIRASQGTFSSLE